MEPYMSSQTLRPELPLMQAHRPYTGKPCVFLLNSPKLSQGELLDTWTLAGQHPSWGNTAGS